MAFDREKMMGRFIQDGREHIRRLTDGVMQLESGLSENPDESEGSENSDTGRIFDLLMRSAHSLKGASRMMNLSGISELAHHLEDAFLALKDGIAVPDGADAVDLLLSGVDEVDRLFQDLTDGEREVYPDTSLVASLSAMARGEGGAAPESAGSVDSPKERPTDSASQATTRLTDEPDEPDEPAPAPVAPAPPQKAETEKKRESAPAPESPQTPSSTPSTSPASAKPSAPASPGSKAEKSPPAASPRMKMDSIRVNAGKLDEVINLLGEAVSGYNRYNSQIDALRQLERKTRQILEEAEEGQDLSAEEAVVVAEVLAKGIEDGTFSDLSSSGLAPGLNFGSRSAPGPETVSGSLLSELRGLGEDIHRYMVNIREEISLQQALHTEIQEKTVRLRMQPLTTLFETLPRSVRDAARSAGKQVKLVTRGGETELDREIIEKTGDPLIHMIRNAVAHGIETPEERKRLGKPEVGCLRLEARYEGNSVLITLSDDGAGLPVDKIRSRAVDRNLLNQTAARRETDANIVNLIFQPGFSTSDMITELSGRGMGMDVVRKNIVDELKGSLHVETRQGKGATFYLRLPLTMSINHVLFIRSGNLSFALPTNFVLEIIRLPLSQAIDVVGRKAVRLRDAIIPAVFLGEILNMTDAMPDDAGRLDMSRSRLVIVVTSGGENLGLIVDDLLAEADVVIRPLPEHLKFARMVSGCAISGDNAITISLHIPRLIEAASEIRGAVSALPSSAKIPAPPSARDDGEDGSDEESEEKDIHILVIDDSVSTREIEKSILESYGYQVTLAGDGVEGLEKAEEFPYALVITDVEMPRMDGFALTRRLRTLDSYRKTPVVLLTSLDREEDKRRGMEAGANAYIVKGDFDQSNLLGTIRSLVG